MPTIQDVITKLQTALATVAAYQAPAPAPAPAPTPYPAWRANATVGVPMPIVGTEKFSGVPLKVPTNGVAIDYSELCAPWIGYASDGKRRLFNGPPGGHSGLPGSNFQNQTLAVDLGVDAPKWTMLDAGSDYADVQPAEHAATYGDRYADGRPVSRHSTYLTQFIPAEHNADGKARLIMFGCWAPYAIYFSPPGYQGGPDVAAFVLDSAQWEPAGPKLPFWTTGYGNPSCCRDPRDSTVWMGGAAKGLWKRDALTGAWTNVVPLGPLRDWNSLPTIVDTKRNAVVCLHYGSYYAPPPAPAGTVNTTFPPRLQVFDIAKNVVTEIMVSGPLLSDFDITASVTYKHRGIVYDADGDRYVVQMDSRLYAVDPTTGASALLCTLPTRSNAAVESKPQYLADLGGIVTGTSQYADPLYFIPTR